MKWFRWHRGTIERAKFKIIANRASVSGMGGGSIHTDRVDGAVFLTDVIAIWAYILEDASNSKHWGYVTHSSRDIAVTLDLGHEEVQAVLNEMSAENMISKEQNNTYKVTSWEKYQYITDSKDNTAAERQRRRRERIRHESVTDVTRDSHDQIQITDTETEKKEKEVFSLPDFIPEETWNNFLDHRKAIKKPATLHAKKLLVGKIEKLKLQGNDPKKVLEQSIVSGWQDVFPLKEDYKPDKPIRKMPSPAGGVAMHERTTCPKCSHKRKGRNKNVKCLSVEKTTEFTVWYCHHCGDSGGTGKVPHGKSLVPRDSAKVWRERIKRAY